MTAKQAIRMKYASDCLTVSERFIHEFHAEVAESMLEHWGVVPELAAYLKGIGEKFR